VFNSVLAYEKVPLNGMPANIGCGVGKNPPFYRWAECSHCHQHNLVLVTFFGYQFQISVGRSAQVALSPFHSTPFLTARQP
jgi:hypothetical protein